LADGHKIGNKLIPDPFFDVFFVVERVDNQILFKAPGFELSKLNLELFGFSSVNRPVFIKIDPKGDKIGTKSIVSGRKSFFGGVKFFLLSGNSAVFGVNIFFIEIFKIGLLVEVALVVIIILVLGK